MAHPHVQGIGGIFFRAKDTSNIVEEGSIWMQEAGPTVFSPFKEDTDYFGSKDQQFMINLRINDLDTFVKTLEAAGVKLDEKRESSEYGSFAWAYDPEGRKIELWQPPEN